MLMAKPIPSMGVPVLEPPRSTTVLMPTSSPDTLIKGPPLLPGLITVSVWTRSYSSEPPPALMVRPRAETTPTVTVGPPGRSSALPMAITHSPTRGGAPSSSDKFG